MSNKIERTQDENLKRESVSKKSVLHRIFAKKKKREAKSVLIFVAKKRDPWSLADNPDEIDGGGKSEKHNQPI